MNNNYDLEDIKNKLRDKGAENGSLTSTKMQAFNP